MITNFLLDNQPLIPVALALILAACTATGYLLIRRPRILWTLAGLSLLPIVALTLVPTTSRITAVTCTVQFAVPTLHTVELLANVALFFPAAYFTTLATRRPLAPLTAAVLLSAAIEAVQALIPAIGRACDTNDWAMNTAGIITAAALAKITLMSSRATPAPQTHAEYEAE